MHYIYLFQESGQANRPRNRQGIPVSMAAMVGVLGDILVFDDEYNIYRSRDAD